MDGLMPNLIKKNLGLSLTVLSTVHRCTKVRVVGHSDKDKSMFTC